MKKKYHFVIRFCHQQYFICIFLMLSFVGVPQLLYRKFQTFSKNSTLKKHEKITLFFFFLMCHIFDFVILSFNCVFFQTIVIFIISKNMKKQFDKKALLVRTVILELDAFNIHSDIKIF